MESELKMPSADKLERDWPGQEGKRWAGLGCPGKRLVTVFRGRVRVGKGRLGQELEMIGRAGTRKARPSSSRKNDSAMIEIQSKLVLSLNDNWLKWNLN
jgi:hypothetical protein